MGCGWHAANGVALAGMNAQQPYLSQTVTEARLPYERYVSALNRHPWWAWIVILFAYLGILFVFAILLSPVFRAQVANPQLTWTTLGTQSGPIPEAGRSQPNSEKEMKYPVSGSSKARKFLF